MNVFFLIIPFATDHALFLTTFLISSNLFIKSHFPPITGWSFGQIVSIHGWFLSNWLSSSYMAIIQFESLRPFRWLLGSLWDTNTKKAQKLCKDEQVLTPCRYVCQEVIHSMTWFIFIMSLGFSSYRFSCYMGWRNPLLVSSSSS